MIGKQIAHHRIEAKLGEGGMGEVYRARDTRLNRDVALKKLPESFSLDTERMARFSREAQLLASLNHPNKAAICGLEEAIGTRVLVMELVQGEDLPFASLYPGDIVTGAHPRIRGLRSSDRVMAVAFMEDLLIEEQ